MSLNGKKIGEFKLQAYQNEDFIEVTDKDLLGKWSVLLFYPADFTFVCPTELEDLENKYADFKKIGCEIYSVSCDTHFVHKAWHESSDRIGKVEYPMIGDPTGKLAKDLDVYIEDAGQAERGTFVINPDGEVVLYEVSAATSDVMLMNCSARLKLLSSFTNTAMKFARQNGIQVKKP